VDAAAEREFQAAMAAQDHGDLDKAESMLIALRAHHPGIFAVDESLGLLYASRGQFTAALPLLQAAVKENPSSAVAHANLGTDDLKLGKNSEAIKQLQFAAKLNPKDKETQSNLGQALSSDGQPVQAAQAFASAVALDPNDSDLRCDWAAVLLDAGEADQAAQAIAPIQNQDTVSRVQALLGEIAERQGQFLDAANHLQAAAKLDPSEANVYLLGVEYLKHWTFDAAIEYFQYGVTHYPASRRMLLGLGFAYYSKSQVALATPIFAQLLDADPENATYAELLGRSCTVMPETIKECDKLEQFAEANTKNAVVGTTPSSSAARGPTI
jgi:predicted Zn-dependent protease